MFHKALWYQNYKQTRMVVWILLVLYIVHLPFQALLTIESWRKTIEEMSLYPDWVFEVFSYQILLIFSQGPLPFFVFFAVILLACMLIGSERNTRRMDFTFSLPFSRRDIFLAKLIYGALIIFVFHTINFIVAYWIIRQSEFQYIFDQVNSVQIYYGPLLGLLLIFIFALFIGTISGEMISQVALTLIFGIFPIGFAYLTMAFFELNFNYYLHFPRWIRELTILFYVFNESQNLGNLIIPILGIILFSYLGVELYKRNRIEHNGEFLIFKRLHTLFLIGMTLCFSLLGGMIFASLAPWNAHTLQVVSYWLGFSVFLLFSYLISKRLLRMNLMVKNK